MAGDHVHDEGAAPRWKHDGVRVIRGDQLDASTAQTPGMFRQAAINHARVGAQERPRAPLVVSRDSRRQTMADPHSTEDKALDSLSVAPPKPQERPDRDAGQDESINKRLERNPESKEARLDTALDESMDASDPPSSTQPVHSQDPAPSSGYDADEEKRRKGKG